MYLLTQEWSSGVIFLEHTIFNSYNVVPISFPNKWFLWYISAVWQLWWCPSPSYWNIICKWGNRATEFLHNFFSVFPHTWQQVQVMWKIWGMCSRVNYSSLQNKNIESLRKLRDRQLDYIIFFWQCRHLNVHQPWNVYNHDDALPLISFLHKMNGFFTLFPVETSFHISRWAILISILMD